MKQEWLKSFPEGGLGNFLPFPVFQGQFPPFLRAAHRTQMMGHGTAICWRNGITATPGNSVLTAAAGSKPYNSVF